MDKEFSSTLSRYYHLIDIYDKMLTGVKKEYINDNRWFAFSERVARKHLTHCKSLCLNSAETFMFDEGEDKRETQFMDIPGIFINLRTQCDTYATLHHIFFDRIGIEINILRFNLWELDSRISLQKNTSIINLDERERIQGVINRILDCDGYKKLKTTQQSLLFKNNEDLNKIYTNWKFFPDKLESNKRLKISWREIFVNAGLKGYIFENAHNFFSMYVHSDFFSVYELSVMTAEKAIAAKTFAINFSSYLITFAMDDFCSRFKEAKDFATKLPPLDIEIIKSFLHTGRERGKIKYFI